jgi:endonuclease-8
MPEGDTIFRAARTLQLALSGRIVTRFETVLPHLARVHEDAPIVGRTVDLVDAKGKWLMMRFSGDLILLTHMLMSGSWHIYRPGEPWQRSRYHMRILIGTAEILAVAFDVPIAEFHTQKTLEVRTGFGKLGPDVLKMDFDEATAIANLQSQPHTEIAVALLTQSLLAGVGNVFKSEVCFTCGINPFRSVGSLDRHDLETLVAVARKQMLANVVVTSGSRRTTRRMNPAERFWVYGRAGQPCRRCGTAIQSRKQVLDARVTFWCPQCQPSR